MARSRRASNTRGSRTESRRKSKRAGGKHKPAGTPRVRRSSGTKHGRRSDRCEELLRAIRAAAKHLSGVATERAVILDAIRTGHLERLDTSVDRYAPQRYSNRLDESDVGLFRPPSKRKCITADWEVVEYFLECEGTPPPGFLEAGPRKYLYFNPKDVKIGVVTPGGIAPGLNTVVHCVVNMHELYGMKEMAYGFEGGFRGIAKQHYRELSTRETKPHIHNGGTHIGTSRDKFEPADIALALQELGVNILYVVGGDGSLTCAHQVAREIIERDIRVRGKKIAIAGIPKTMDNDILWVWHSFGFDTAVEEATRSVNAIHDDAKSTERICVMQLFGRDAGFVAAHSALASGQAHMILAPEVRFCMPPLLEYLERILYRDNYALVIVAEGAAPVEYSEDYIHELLRREGYDRRDPRYRTYPQVNAMLADGKLIFIRNQLREHFRDFRGGRHTVFVSQPRHLIRAVPPNSVDQIYCQRLADLAVHNALAGYSDFMISQWLTEYVLVPLRFVADEKDRRSGKRLTKKIPPGGIFWTTVVNSTGQPSFDPDHVERECRE